MKDLNDRLKLNGWSTLNKKLIDVSPQNIGIKNRKYYIIVF